jgi:hypothetical protein
MCHDFQIWECIPFADLLAFALNERAIEFVRNGALATHKMRECSLDVSYPGEERCISIESA